MTRITEVVDAHVHFWNPSSIRYPWLRDIPALERPYLPADFMVDADDAPIRDVVVVEANPDLADARAEARWLDSLSEVDPRICAIVAHVAVDDPNCEGVLGDLSALPRVRGIRHNIQGHPPGWCLRRAFVDGARTVGRHDYTFDLCVTHDQLGELVELVTRCRGTRFVLDHCGKPAIRDRRLEPWATHIARIAERENVVCKLSGLLTEAPPGCDDDHLLPFADHVVDCFGIDRVMYGSDWPVATLAGTYSTWFTFIERFTSGWSSDKRHAFHSGNAKRFYNVQLSSPAPATRESH
jgi:L-fuconolactonase